MFSVLGYYVQALVTEQGPVENWASRKLTNIVDHKKCEITSFLPALTDAEIGRQRNPFEHLRGDPLAEAFPEEPHQGCRDLQRVFFADFLSSTRRPAQC